MDVGDLTSGKNNDLIGSESEGMESRVDDSKLAGAPVDGVGEATMVDKGGEQQVEMPFPDSGILPGVATPPVLGQVIPVVDQAMEKRKRGRPPRGYVPKLPTPKIMKVEEEDVCFICFDGGSLVLCDRKGCPKAYHPACIKRDEAFFQSTARWDCGWHICSVCQKASHHFCYTCTYSLCKKCTKDSKYVSVKGNKGFCSTCMETIMMIENKDAGNNDSILVDFDDKGSWEYLFKVYWVLLKKKLSLTLNDLMQAKNPWKGVIVTDLKTQLPVKINVAEDIAPPPPSEQSEPLILPEQNQVPDQNSEKRKISEGCMDWATQELLEFVGHMKNGDTSILSQFDVQALLMEYIKVNNLRNPHQKSQIICDSRLKSLFGKPRVGHIEMLKLLEYHYLITEDIVKNTIIPAGIVGSASIVSTDSNNYSVLRSKKQKARKKSEEKSPHVNLDDYAAIDVHNIKLIFLRRNMMENLLDQVEMFDEKVVGSIVRIRVSTNDQKQDIYRLVQVVGTSKGGESYKIGEKTTDIMLEVLNLDKKEMMSIVGISNQEFSEEECRRLRQSIKWGLVKRLTVGEVQSKAIALLALRFDDWLVAEILRLSHLRDRANEKGHKKELRECVEKLQVLKTPEERQRKLTEIPEVHADPKMNPNYESEDDTRENDMKQDEVLRRDHSKHGIVGSQVLRPKKSVKEDDIDTQRIEKKRDEYGSNCFPQQQDNPPSQPVLRPDSERPITLSVSQTSSPNIQTEKIWHYRDPNGKIQGPFSITQLQKWSTTGYFPEKMSIWTDHVQFSNNPFLLSDVLDQQFRKRISPEPARETVVVTDNRRCDSENNNNNNYNNNNNNAAETQVAAETEDLLVLESSGQNRPPVLNLDLNSGDCNIASVTNLNPNLNPNPNPNPNDSTEHSKVNLDLVELPSPTPKTETKKLEINPNEQESVFMDIQAAEMLRSLSSAYVPTNGKTVSDVPSPKPKPVDVKTLPNPEPPEPSNETHAIGQCSGPLEFSLQDLGWTNTCGQDSAEPSCKEWDFGLVPMSSLKPTEPVDGSNSDSNLPFHPLPNMSSWALGIHEPIEFTTLAEESVSDLLAEVDAMESQIGMGPTSPSSAMRYGDGNDCFSSIEELSPNTDASKSDAISFPSQQAESNDHSIGASQIDGFDPVKRTDLNSSGKTESGSYPINIWENRSDIHPPPPPPINQAMINATSHNWASVQGNMGWAGPPPPPPQAFVDQWIPSLNPTSSWANPNLSLGSYNGNPGWDNNPHRFTGSRDWQFQGGGGGDMGFGRGGGGGGGDMGFGRGGGGGGSSRPMWNRQQHGGSSGGGGYSRPNPKGQRVCKFYESGHCKKGASCGYLHP